ncbi:ABC transporter permease [Desulfovibrio inopinatus]|uniref:ABC transporter permease n=1 Tax=Desulfovibrio inopinatus TaxID=102109 RepID=UPI0004092D14|nr:ABC transporter permease [Desulfovibrio inopinatus]
MRKRRRYVGVMAAIALGTAGMIIIITMGRDLKSNFNNDLDLLGGATIMNARFERINHQPQEWFQQYTMEAISRIPGVMDTTRVVFKPQAVTTWHDQVFGFNILGVEADYWHVFSFTAEVGRLFTAEEVREGRRVVVLGQDIARRIFGGNEQAIGQLINIDNNLYEVIGVLGGVRALDKSLFAFLPLPTAQARIQQISTPYSAYIRCETWDDVEPIAKALPNVIKTYQADRGLQVIVAWEPLKQVQRVFWWVSLFIYASIGATLVLSGFGIWNIMMAAVTSRTREIGLKKAMGAEDNDILLQFLFEALFVTVGASVFGIILGRAGVEYMSRLLGAHPPEGLFWLCLAFGLGFAALLGIGSGLYPSIRASRMQVVEAMRYE